MIEPTLDTIIDITDGELARDEESVIVSYGALGYYRLTPDTVIRDGEEHPAVAIRGRLTRQDGKHSADLRDTLRAGGLEIR